jgi:hypothetical protein
MAEARVVLARADDPPGFGPCVGVDEEEMAHVEIRPALMSHGLARLMAQRDERRTIGMGHDHRAFIQTEPIGTRRIQSDRAEREPATFLEAYGRDPRASRKCRGRGRKVIDDLALDLPLSNEG